MTGAEAFGSRFDVSRETLGRLETYQVLLARWNPRINLVARSTVDSVWDRHFTDSAQLFALRPADARVWADLGSGGGFPGLVIAILAAEAARALRVTLVESDQRKCAFLSTVLRETGVAATVLARRIEFVPPLGADVVSARALAPLETLIGYAQRHLAPGGRALFLKGESLSAELDIARRSWRFTQEIVPSLTDPSAAVVVMKDIAHV